MHQPRLSRFSALTRLFLQGCHLPQERDVIERRFQHATWNNSGLVLQRLRVILDVILDDGRDQHYF